MRSRPRLVVSLVFVAAASSVRAQDLGPEIVRFAEAHRGKRVGDGQCSSLAIAAVMAAGGIPFYKLGPTGEDADYVWGDLIVTLTPQGTSASQIKPGDVIQFRETEFARDTRTTERSGRWKSGYSYLHYGHHTAIVRAVKGNFIEVLHQNVGPDGAPDEVKRIVQSDTIWVGSTRKASDSGTSRTETVYRFTKGTIWVYRARR